MLYYTSKKVLIKLKFLLSIKELNRNKLRVGYVHNNACIIQSDKHVTLLPTYLTYTVKKK